MTKQPQKASVGQAVRKLGEIDFSGYSHEAGYAIVATASFGRPKFEWGEYTVQIGLTQAALALDHPGYTATEPYQAFLSSKFWTEKTKERTQTETKAGLLAQVGARLSFATVSAQGGAARENSSSREILAQTEYPLVSRQPSRWVIGGDQGDPRQPNDDEMGACLRGSYLDGDRGADTAGAELKLSGKARKPLCIVSAKAGANNAKVTALLIAPVDSLKIRIDRSQSLTQKLAGSIDLQGRKERELKLRTAIIEVCLTRAKRRQFAEHLLSGELPIHVAERILQLPKTQDIKPVVTPSAAEKKNGKDA